VCSGGNTGITPNACVDCAGVVNGTASLDNCGICSGGTTGITPNQDSDGDQTLDCNDGCPNDPDKIAPGVCGCGKPDTNLANAGADDDICSGEAALLNATGGGTYVWSTNETTANIAVAPANTTTYRVTVTNTNNCVTTDSVTITVNPLPVANAGQNFAICIGDTTTLLASGGGTYEWNTGATTADEEVSPVVQTDYSVTVIDANGCADADTVTIVVNQLPTANAGANQTICQGDTATLTGSGGITFNWTTGANTVIIEVSPVQTASYQLLVSDANNCLDIDSVTVSVNPLPTVSITGLAATYCDDTSGVVLQGSPTGGTFSGAGISGTIFDPSSISGGNYDIVYTYTDNNSCTNSVTANTTVDICSGIEEMDGNLKVAVYPNPFTDHLTIGIQAEKNVSLQIKLTDAQGKTIAMQQVEAGQTLRNVTFSHQKHLAAGVYLLQVEGQNVNMVYRVLKAE
jgi:hypothetical protein